MFLYQTLNPTKYKVRIMTHLYWVVGLFKRTSHDILYGVLFVNMESKYVVFYILP